MFCNKKLHYCCGSDCPIEVAFARGQSVQSVLQFSHLQPLHSPLGTLSPPMDRKQQQRQEKFIAELMAKDEGNKSCADCSQKGTRWASWNIGVFLCIHCGAIHRKMGPHISKVKSISLDSWTEEQLQWIAERGNTKMNRFYNPSERQFPSHGEAAKEQFIRDKYERKAFVANAQIRQSLEHEQQEFTARHAKMSRPWAHELAKLREMGFVEEGQEEACYAVCERFKGDVNQSIAYLLEHQARKDKAPMQLSAKHLQKSPSLQPKAQESTLAEGEILRQLKKMGFKDERENLTTLRSCEGDLGKCVVQLVQHSKQEQTSESGWEEDAVEFNEFVSTPTTTSIHSDKKALSNNDILSLFDDFSPAVQHKQQQEQISSKPLITKELLDIFSPVQNASPSEASCPVAPAIPSGSNNSSISNSLHESATEDEFTEFKPASSPTLATSPAFKPFAVAPLPEQDDLFSVNPWA